MGKHGWTHSICGLCYAKMHPDRVPVRVLEHSEEMCCFCGGPTREGIYVRADPRLCLCWEKTDV